MGSDGYVITVNDHMRSYTHTHTHTHTHPCIRRHTLTLTHTDTHRHTQHSEYTMCTIYLESCEVQMIGRFVKKKEIVRDQYEGSESHSSFLSTCNNTHPLRVNIIYGNLTPMCRISSQRCHNSNLLGFLLIPQTHLRTYMRQIAHQLQRHIIPI